MTSRDWTEDLLARQGQSLRALARALVRDEHAAEDLVQDAWVAALRKPPARSESSDGWFRTVLRHAAVTRFRRERRRHEREESQARAEAQDAQPTAHASTLAAVTSGVLSLEEPYRSTVLARWYEGLPPRAIAERDGVPVATVKSRLVRAHAQLRTRLERELGADSPGKPERGWRAALCALAGEPLLPPPALQPVARPLAFSPATGTLGLLVMSVKLPLVLGSLAMGALCFVLLAPEKDADSAHPAAVQPAEAKADSAVLQGGVEAIAAEADPERAPLAQATAELATSDLSRECLLGLRTHVRDEIDLPIAGARVYLAPRDGAFCFAGETNALGDLELTIATYARAFDAWVAVVAPDGQTSGIQEVHLQADVPTELDLGLEVAREFERAELAAISLVGTVESGDGSSFYLRIVSSSRPLGDPTLAGSPQMRSDENGVQRFSEVAGRGGCPANLAVGNVARHFEADGRRAVDLRAGLLESATFSLGASQHDWVVGEEGGRVAFFAPELVDLQTAVPATLAGRVIDAESKPVGHAPVAVLAPDGSVRTRGECDEAGEYRFENVVPGPVILAAGGGGGGIARVPMELAPGNDHFQEAVLDRGVEFSGALVTESGEPLSGWIVEVAARDAHTLWTKRSRTDDEGRFRFTNVQGSAVELFVYGEGEEARLPRLVHGPLAPGGAIPPLVVGHAERLAHRVSLEILDPSGFPALNTWARLESPLDGHAILLQLEPDGRRFSASDLPAGRLRLVIGAAGGLTTTIEDLDLAGGNERDLESIVLEPDAGLALAAAPESCPDGGSVQLWRERRTHRSYVGDLGFGEARTDALAAGSYALVGVDGARAVRLGAGQALRLARNCDGAGFGALELELGTLGAMVPPLERDANGVPTRPGVFDGEGGCTRCHLGAAGAATERREVFGSFEPAGGQHLQELRVRSLQDG